MGSDPYTTCSTIDKTLPSPARYCYQTVRLPWWWAFAYGIAPGVTVLACVCVMAQLKASKEQPLPVGYVSNVTIVTNFNDGTAAASSQDVVVQPFITPDYMKALNAIKTPQPVRCVVVVSSAASHHTTAAALPCGCVRVYRCARHPPRPSLSSWGSTMHPQTSPCTRTPTTSSPQCRFVCHAACVARGLRNLLCAPFETRSLLTAPTMSATLD